MTKGSVDGIEVGRGFVQTEVITCGRPSKQKFTPTCFRTKGRVGSKEDVDPNVYNEVLRSLLLRHTDDFGSESVFLVPVTGTYRLQVVESESVVRNS